MTISDVAQLHTDIDPSLLAVFPPTFQWGAATASYQIEGAAHEDGRGPSIWDAFAAKPGAVYQGQNGDVANDHYHRMREDVALMARLGLRAYRFSIAWPRIIPQGTGDTNPPGIAFYDRLIDTLLEHNITPYPTLYHWDLPLPLHDLGGWLSRNTAYAYADYVDVITQALGDRVKHWITLNEPFCAAREGYGTGRHAPGLKDMQATIIAGHHLLLGHGLAVERIHRNVPDAQVGVTLDLSPAYPADDRPETQAAVAQLDRFRNRWLLDAVFKGSYPAGMFEEQGVAAPPIQKDDMATISRPIDFLGINYYSRMVVTAEALGKPDFQGTVYPVPGSSYTGMGWEVFPQGLTDILVRVNKDYAPRAIYITENGAAYDDEWDGEETVNDAERQSYLVTHVEAVARAIEQGVPMQGYFCWSFMDNFEWGLGYSKRFGIVYVDYPTQQRIVKASGHWYRDLLARAPGARNS